MSQVYMPYIFLIDYFCPDSYFYICTYIYKKLCIFSECVPISECPAFDDFTNTIEQLEPGFVQMMNTSGCCPRLIKICDPTTCPPASNCPDYYKAIANIHADSCCPIYECGIILFLYIYVIIY